MSYVMTSTKIVDMAKLAAGCRTLYIKGCFGAPMNQYNKLRYSKNNTYNKAPERQKLIQNATTDTFGFDCVNLIKGILWGWCADKDDIYGGARFKSNGVPDVDDSAIMDYCTTVSDDFTKILPGEILHIPGHVGLYIGDGLAIECTARWKDGVQITSVFNLGTGVKNNGRVWAEHGRLQWVEYKEPSKLPTYELHVSQVKKGCKGESVSLAQVLLNSAIDAGLEVDGVCGSGTDKAIKTYQTLHGMSADGIIGTKTWSTLLGIEVKMDA